MNASIDLLRTMFTAILPEATFKVDEPLDQDWGATWLDIFVGELHITILHRPWLGGYGLYLPKPPEEYGMGEMPDEHYETVALISERVLNLIKELIIR